MRSHDAALRLLQRLELVRPVFDLIELRVALLRVQERLQLIALARVEKRATSLLVLGHEEFTEVVGRVRWRHGVGYHVPRDDTALRWEDGAAAT